MASFAPPPQLSGGPGGPGPVPPPSPAGPAAPPPGISGLIGGDQTATSIGPTPQQRVEAYMVQVRNIHMEIDALAQMHPEASNELNNAKNALTESMAKVATATASPDQGPQPPVV